MTATQRRVLRKLVDGAKAYVVSDPHYYFQRGRGRVAVSGYYGYHSTDLFAELEDAGLVEVVERDCGQCGLPTRWQITAAGRAAVS